MKTQDDYLQAAGILRQLEVVERERDAARQELLFTQNKVAALDRAYGDQIQAYVKLFAASQQVIDQLLRTITTLAESGGNR